MVKIEKNVIINAPVEKVFKYWTDPINRPEVWPSLVEIKDVKKVSNDIVTDFGWVYKMAGMRLEGTTKMLEHVADQRYVEQSKGGVDSIMTWDFEPQNGHTKMTFIAEYTVPMPVIGKLVDIRCFDQATETADLCKASVIEQKDDDVGRIFFGFDVGCPPFFRVFITLGDNAIEIFEGFFLYAIDFLYAILRGVRRGGRLSLVVGWRACTQ